MKFVLFFICAFVAVQGFQAHSLKPAERDLQDIIDTIKNVINKIKEIISNIGSQIPEIIQNIKDKIAEIIKNIPDIINNLKKKIEELIQAAGEVGTKCVEAQREQIQALVESAQAGVQNCVAEAESKTAALQKQVDVLVGKLEALRDDIIARSMKCVEDNKLNPIGLYNCLREQVGPVQEELVAIQQEVVNTIALAQQIATEVANGLTECSAKLQEEIAVKETEILNAIKDCITSAA